MSSNPGVVRKHINLIPEESHNAVQAADLDLLIERGKLEKDGNWYRVYDLRILGNELYGLIRRIFITPKETLIQLY